MALGYPEVGFTLMSGGRRAARVPAGGGAAASGSFSCSASAPTSIEIHKEAGGLQIARLRRRARRSGPVRGQQNVFVNRRIVRDRTIAHAIIDAYSVATIKERSPEVHLFIQIPPDRVDVNVHPTKAEVRFLEQSLVHEVLRRGLARRAGAGHGAGAAADGRCGPAPREPPPMTIPGVLAGASVGNRWSPEHDAALRTFGPSARRRPDRQVGQTPAERRPT